tara:strand:+ start:162 stop:383 length:222 start_codon:yes stop_codon:yes gene_type:complete
VIAVALKSHRLGRKAENIIKKFPALRIISFDGRLSKIKKVNRNKRQIIILVVFFENKNIQNNNKKYINIKKNI